MKTEEKTCKGNYFPQHGTRIDDEELGDRDRDRSLIEFKYGKFPFKEPDQREINKGKFYLSSDVES